MALPKEGLPQFHDARALTPTVHELPAIPESDLLSLEKFTHYMNLVRHMPPHNQNAEDRIWQFRPETRKGDLFIIKNIKGTNTTPGASLKVALHTLCPKRDDNTFDMTHPNLLHSTILWEENKARHAIKSFPSPTAGEYVHFLYRPTATNNLQLYSMITTDENGGIVPQKNVTIEGLGLEKTTANITLPNNTTVPVSLSWREERSVFSILYPILDQTAAVENEA